MDKQELSENSDNSVSASTSASREHETETDAVQDTLSDVSVSEVNEEQEQEESKADLVNLDAVLAVDEELAADDVVSPVVEPPLETEPVTKQGGPGDELQEMPSTVADDDGGGTGELQEDSGEIGPASGQAEEQPVIADAEDESSSSFVVEEEVIDPVVEKMVDLEASAAPVAEAASDAASALVADEASSSKAVPLQDDISTARHLEVSDIFARTQGSWNAELSAQKDVLPEQVFQLVFDLSEKVALLSTTTAAMTVTIQKISDETEQMVGWSHDVKVTSALSKVFLALSILVLVLLLGGMSYLAIGHYNAQHHLHAAQTAVAGTIKVQQKQIAEYDKHFADLVGGELKKEREASSKASVHDRINRLRNGLAEQPLHRKNNGDWFVASGKNEVSITDPEIIEELNQAFVKSGRTLTVPYLVPPHKAVIALRPNGKGGTDIVVTKDVVP